MELDDLTRTFKSARDLVVLSIEKLSAQGEYTLRAALRKKNIRLKGVKNSLTRKVFKELDLYVPDDAKYWERPTLIAWGSPSVKELSREIDEELTESKNAVMYRGKVTIKGAIADGQAVLFKDALEMPTRLEVIGQIVGMLLSPASAIAGCLTGPVAQVASQIEKISEKKDEGAAAPNPTPAP
jgi:large subunit ribosomal protein L10